MTAAQFAAECNRHIQAGHDFLAYWHPAGFMLLRQGTIETTVYRITVEGGVRDPDTTYTTNSAEERDALLRHYGRQVKEVKPKTTTKKVKASTVNKLRKIIEQLKKQRGIGPVYVVERVGDLLRKEGADPDVLQAIQLPGSGHPVDT